MSRLRLHDQANSGYLYMRFSKAQRSLSKAMEALLDARGRLASTDTDILDGVLVTIEACRAKLQVFDLFEE